MSTIIRQKACEAFPIHFSNGVTDHKAWAKRIVERERLGDKTLMAVQIRFAKQALGQA